METGNNHLKGGAKLSVALLTVLLIGAFVFYKTRIFSDAAFISFYIINSGNLQIQCERFGSFITQMIPAIATRLHLPLKAILLAYTVSFNVFFLGTALFIYYRLKDYALVILMGCYYCLFVSDTYFWTNNELHQGMSWMFLLFGFLKYYGMKEAQTGRRLYTTLSCITVIIFGFLAIFSHPVIIFPLVFLWVFYYLDKSAAPFNKRASLIYLLILLVIFGFRYFFSTTNTYDGNFAAHLKQTTIRDVIHAVTNETAQYFGNSITHKNWLLPVIFITSVAYLILKRKYLLLAWVLLVNIGFFVLLCLTFTDRVEFYLESEFQPYGIFCATVFVYYVLPSMKGTTMVLILAAIFAIRVGVIFAASKKFVARSNRIEEVLTYMKRQQLTKMVLLKQDNRFEKDMISTWGLAYETLMHSRLNGDSVNLTFLYIDQKTIDKQPLPDSLKNLRTNFRFYYKQQLNKRYFAPDSLHPYVIRTYDEVFKR